jgi:hypothetical protein
MKRFFKKLPEKPISVELCYNSWKLQGKMLFFQFVQKKMADFKLKIRYLSNYNS